MEDFAADVAESGTAENIAQMYDQYLNFIVSEPDLFSLGMRNEAYWALNSNQVKDEEIDVLVDRAVTGLFSVVVTMGLHFSPTRLIHDTNTVSRIDTNNTKSSRWASRNDRCKIRSQAPGSHFEFERQPLLNSGAASELCRWIVVFKACASHC